MKTSSFILKTILIYIYCLLSNSNSLYADWNLFNGPQGGDFKSLTSVSGTLYAAVYGKGVLKSTNNGDTWIYDYGDSLSPLVMSVTACSGNLIAGLFFDPNFVQTFSNAFILQRNLSSSNWISINNSISPSNNSWVNSLTSNSNTVVACVQGFTNNLWGFRTNNSGQSFNWLYAIQQSQFFQSAAHDSTFLATIQGGAVFRSTNAGSNWTITGVSIDGNIFINSNFIFGASSTQGIRFSSDNGEIWTTRNTGLPVFSGNVNCASVQYQNNNVFAIVKTSGSVNLNNFGLYKSTNLGINWLKVNSANFDTLGGGRLYSFNNILYNSRVNNQALLRSIDDGQNWVITNNISARAVSHIEFNSNNDMFAIGNGYLFTSYVGLHRYNNTSQTWSELTKNIALKIGGYPTSIGNLGITDNNTIFVSANGRIYKSTNNGDSFDTGRTCSILRVHNNDLLCSVDGVPDQLYFSSNYGSTWLNRTPVGNIEIGDIQFNGNNILLNGTGLRKSTNNGVNWTTLSTIGAYNLNIRCEDSLICLFHPLGVEVKISTDGGFSFPGSFTVGTAERTNDVMIYNKHIYITYGYGKIFKSTDFGNSWISIRNGLSKYTFINKMQVHEDRFYTLTRAGMYYRSLNEVGINTISEIVPERFRLEQNYPNPFNPETKIRYDVSFSANVSLKVFDINGREVETLVSEKQSPGTYEVTFDASSLPSGVYFYKIESDNFNESKKMIVLK